MSPEHVDHSVDDHPSPCWRQEETGYVCKIFRPVSIDWALKKEHSDEHKWKKSNFWTENVWTSYDQFEEMLRFA